MNTTQNSTDNFVVTTAIKEKISLGQNLAEQNQKTFVAAIFKTIASQDLVSVSVPAETAKYLKPVKGHEIMVFADEKMNKLTMIGVKDHFVHGDFMVRKDDGQVKPSVIRHFCVKPNSLGKVIAANVVIKEKKCLLTGTKTIVIDIMELLPGTYLVKHQLKLGAEVTGKQGEVKIPATDRCIRFEEVKAQQITNYKKEEKTEKKSADDGFIIEEAKTERRHRLLLKPVEKVEINKPLSLKKMPTKEKSGGKTIFEIFKETSKGTQRIIHLMHN